MDENTNTIMSPISAIIRFCYEQVEEGVALKGSAVIEINSIDSSGDTPIGTITYVESGSEPLKIWLVAGDPVNE